MIQIFTQNDIIRYIYKETSEEETHEIDNALLCDSNLLEMYLELNASKNKLDKILKSPSELVINSILNYSRSLDGAVAK